MKKGVSIIICCYNSVPRLHETLKHLSLQKVPANINWEVVVVDNASNDNTSGFAIETWNSLPAANITLNVIQEPIPGLMHARIAGARAATYEYLVFCDDDNWLNEDYINNAYLAMDADELIGAAGGQNTAVTDAQEYPEWFPEYQDKYALGIPADRSGDITQRGFILGAGMVTRRSLFLQISEHYPSLLKGRNGKHLNAGEDFEYCKRLILREYKLYYNERMKLQHFIPKERLTIEYRNRLMKGILEAGEVISVYDSFIEMKESIGNKNQIRLLLMAPSRILFGKLGWFGREEKKGTTEIFFPFSTFDYTRSG